MDKNWTTCAFFLWITQPVVGEQVNVNLYIFGYIYSVQYFALKTDMKSSSMEPLKMSFFYNCTQNGVFKNEGPCSSNNHETNMIVMRDLNRQLCELWAGDSSHIYFVLFWQSFFLPTRTPPVGRERFLRAFLKHGLVFGVSEFLKRRSRKTRLCSC